MLRLLDGVIDGESEHGGVPLGQIGFQFVEQLSGGRVRGIVPEVFDGLEVGGKGIGEGVRFAVEGLFVVGVGPVFFRGHAEEDHGAGGGPQVGAGVAIGLH